MASGRQGLPPEPRAGESKGPRRPHSRAPFVVDSGATDLSSFNKQYLENLPYIGGRVG